MRYTICSIASLLILVALAPTAHSQSTAPEVSLDWNRSPDAAVTGYRVYYGTASGSYTTGMDVGNVTNTPVATPPPGATWFYTVTAYNSTQESDFGDEVTYTAPLALTNPPIAATFQASGVTAESATLTGLVNPNGLSTTRWFDWGETTDFGNQTAPLSAGNGSDTVSVNEVVPELAPGTTYYFRLAATNSAGAAVGQTRSFTTSVMAPTVSTEPATGIRWRFATVNGLVNPNGAATTVWFEYGAGTDPAITTTPVDVAAGSISVPVSASLSGLTSGTQYYYRLVATNVAGKVVSPDTLFQTNTRRK